jgi:hypothetical protein
MTVTSAPGQARSARRVLLPRPCAYLTLLYGRTEPAGVSVEQAVGYDPWSAWVIAPRDPEPPFWMLVTAGGHCRPSRPSRVFWALLVLHSCCLDGHGAFRIVAGDQAARGIDLAARHMG